LNVERKEGEGIARELARERERERERSRICKEGNNTSWIPFGLNVGKELSI